MEPTERLVYERLAYALEAATAYDRSRVQDVLIARGDNEISAGDVLEISEILDIPAGLLLDRFEGDLLELLGGMAV